MAHILNWITCGIKMMSLHYGWGWRPPQTICSIHMKHVQNSSSLTQLNQSSMAQILGFWVTSGVKMMSLRHGWGWQPTQTIYWYIWDIYKVFEHIDMLSIDIWLKPYTVLTTLLLGSNVGVLGHLWNQNDVITSWLRLTATPNYLLHPYEIFTKCFSNFLCWP